MDTASLVVLMVLGVLAWYWFNSIHALEVARKIGRQRCSELELQFLDDTVASIGLRLARDQSGRRVFRRIYRFEFSETGNSRREGRLVLLGGRLESITMEPYEILTE
jgi:hypothetical protein